MPYFIPGMCSTRHVQYQACAYTLYIYVYIIYIYICVCMYVLYHSRHVQYQYSITLQHCMPHYILLFTAYTHTHTHIRTHKEPCQWHLWEEMIMFFLDWSLWYNMCLYLRTEKQWLVKSRKGSNLRLGVQHVPLPKNRKTSSSWLPTERSATIKSGRMRPILGKSHTFVAAQHGICNTRMMASPLITGV